MNTKLFQRGFTIMEMLVVVSLFSFTVLIVTDLFLMVTRLQRKTTETQTLETNVQYGTEIMVRNVRQGLIDYDYYKSKGVDLSNKTWILAVRDIDRNQIVYRRTGEDGFGDSIESCVMKIETDDVNKCISDTPNPGDWQNIFGTSVIIEDFSLFIAPTFDPFQLNGDNSGIYKGGNIQPRVTFVLRAKNRPQTTASTIHTTYLETTIGSRRYKR